MSYIHDMVLLLEYCKGYHALQYNVMWQSFEYVRADPACEAKPISPDITIPSCLKVASYFIVLLKPHLLTRTPTKVTVTADFSFLMFILSNKINVDDTC